MVVVVAVGAGLTGLRAGGVKAALELATIGEADGARAVEVAGVKAGEVKTARELAAVGAVDGAGALEMAG